MRINTGILPLRGRALGALREFNRPAWARCVTEALEGRTVKAAAEELGISWRTLMRWRAELGIHHEKVDSSRDVDLSDVDLSGVDDSKTG